MKTGTNRVDCRSGGSRGQLRSWHSSMGGYGRLASVLIVATILLSIPAGAAGRYPARKNILIISQLGLSHRGYVMLIEEILSGLAGQPDYQVEFYSETLDSMWLTDEASQTAVRSRLVERFSNLKLDAVVSIGPDPIRFLSVSSETLFPEVPIVFCGTFAVPAGGPPLDSRLTGSWLKIEPQRTIDVALKLFPQTERIVVVGGTSAFDRIVETSARHDLRSYEARFDITYMTDLEMGELIVRLGHLPDKTIVLFTSFFRDASGSQFLNVARALPLIARASNAPVFGMSDSYLGHGIVGGYVVSYAEQGRVAARMISEILAGKVPRDIPIVRTSNVYMFDWKELQRWGLRESDLPDGSTVMFRVPTLWERARWILLAGLLVVAVLTFFTGYLLIGQRQLRQAKETQFRLSGLLIDSHEKERRRLASELHDDFSQRLALMTLDLEAAAEMVSKSPPDAERKLHGLVNFVSELGADLHTLSRQLHPSALPTLGLVPGLRAFCKEFAAQYSMQVDFSHGNIPHPVSPDVALCLYRIVQEGLRNSKKHSGASKAQVTLESNGGTLHVSVCDPGVGFDPGDLLKRDGIGVHIMRERARALGGRFEIRSKPQEGTRIDAWVPLQPRSGEQDGSFGGKIRKSGSRTSREGGDCWEKGQEPGRARAC